MRAQIFIGIGLLALSACGGSESAGSDGDTAKDRMLTACYEGSEQANFSPEAFDPKLSDSQVQEIKAIGRRYIDQRCECASTAGIEDLPAEEQQKLIDLYHLEYAAADWDEVSRVEQSDAFGVVIECEAEFVKMWDEIEVVLGR